VPPDLFHGSAGSVAQLTAALAAQGH